MALEIVSNLIESGECCMVVIDSVSALRPKKEIEGEIGDAIVGLQAKNMSQACPKFSISASKKDCTVIFINQIREKVGIVFGSSETTPGGHALKFHASMRLDVRNIGQILDKEGGERVANKTRVTCLKNKGSKPFGKCETRLTYGIGIDAVWETLRIAIEAGIVIKGGSWFSFGESKLGQGENNVLEFLRQDVDTYDAISHLVDQAIITEDE
jgi:recombination protein RecA